MFTTFREEIELISCVICEDKGNDNEMILCDHCQNGFHMRCMKMEELPVGTFYCNSCDLMIAESNVL